MTERPPSAITRHLPLVAALALYLVLTGVGAWQIWHVLGEPIYPIDDAHIHMALARNLAQHGVYGVTPWETTHASSSPLWVLLLAGAFVLAGPLYLIPGLLAALASIAALVIADRVVRERAPGNAFGDLAGRGFVLCLIVIGASLPPLTWQAMEHPLHAALLLLAAWLGAQAIALPKPNRNRAIALILRCCALPVLRYESLWLTALLAAGLLWRRRWGLATALVLASALSVCAVGFWATSRGLTFLPAPILTKSIGPLVMSDNGPLRIAVKLLWHPLWRLGQIPLLAMLFFSAAIYFAIMLWRLRLGVLDRIELVLVGLFAAGTWVHATFATFGWGNRYEAYLIVLGLAALGAAALQLRHTLDASRRSHRVAGVLAGLAAALTIYMAIGRAQWTWANAQGASAEVMDRDFYVARFLAAAYPQESVMAMNIGAVVWEGEPRLLDPVALGTPEALPLIFESRYDLRQIERMARERKVRVLAVFDDWFTQWFNAPPPWIKVAQIESQPYHRLLVLSLYARDEAEAKLLAEKLRSVKPAGRFSVKLKPMPGFE